MQDPLPLPDSELDPDELDELERLPFDSCPDADPSSEDVSDCKHCGEGDLARLCLEGERTAEEEVSGGALASFSICVGSVEVEADRPALTLEAVPPSCTLDNGFLQNIFGLLAVLERREAYQIHAVKPQPGLGVSFRSETTYDG